MNSASFRLGSAHYGGAIYARDMDDFTMTTYDTWFVNNRANINGGAIYLDDLDKYNVVFNRTFMQYNRGRKWGDNIYAR
jgi:predicted outer membrane repeat protein